MRWTEPTESSEQRAVMTWARIARNTESDLDFLVHIPNQGRRTPREGKRYKQMGLAPGFPDLVLFACRGPYGGLAIELKTGHGRVRPNQSRWIEALNDQGYKAVICRGSGEAIDAILRYLRIGEGRHATEKSV